MKSCFGQEVLDLNPKRLNPESIDRIVSFMIHLLDFGALKGGLCHGSLAPFSCSLQQFP